MAFFQLTVNGEPRELDVDPETPLLWVLRDHLNLTGTKYACGVGECGACTVHVDGKVTRSCQKSVQEADGSDVLTIEGLATDEGMHPVQQAWIDAQVPQCGYCQSGQIMSAVALLAAEHVPTDDEINRSMKNICRCGTYSRIRVAIRQLIDSRSEE